MPPPAAAEPPPAPARAEAPAEKKAEPPAAPARAEAPAEVSPAKAPEADPRIKEIEPLVNLGDWDGVLRVLGPDSDAAKLPPSLGLLWAIAKKEKETDESPKVQGLNELAIRCTAVMLGLDPESTTALLVAKRILRKNPVSWRKAPAPSAGVSALIILIAVVLGSAVGWVVSAGYIRIQIR